MMMFPLFTKLYKFKKKQQQKQNIKPSTVGIYLLKVNNRKLEQGAKYVQS